MGSELGRLSHRYSRRPRQVEQHADTDVCIATTQTPRHSRRRGTKYGVARAVYRAQQRLAVEHEAVGGGGGERGLDGGQLQPSPPHTHTRVPSERGAEAPYNSTGVS
jgi:hypothetical protein